MKKTVSLFLCVILICLSSVTIFAADIDIADESKTIFTIDGWIYSVVSGSSNLQVEQYIGSDTELYIPRIVNDRMVVALVDNCFSGNKSIKQVVTSSPLWTVGAYAFLNCSSLETFECNFALKEIGGGAFNGASSLKHINLEDSVVSVIRPLTFMSSGIETITLPETCTEIMSQAFSQCNDLTKIVIPKSVTSIHEDAFKSSAHVTIYCYTDSAAHQYAVSKSIPFVLLDAVVPTEPPTEPLTEPKMFMLGDVDMDGEISITDAATIQRVLAEYTVAVFDEKAALIIAGEELNIADATLIQYYLAEMPTSYAVGEWVAYDE